MIIKNTFFTFITLLVLNSLIAQTTPSDFPSTPTIVSVQNNPSAVTFHQYHNNSATNSNPSVIANHSCRNGYLDVWFEFIVPTSGDVQVYVQGNSLSSGVLSLYTGNYPILNEEFCVTFSSGVELRLIQLTPGSFAMIRVSSSNGNTGTFSLAVKDRNPITTKIKESKKTDISIFPNPTKDKLTIKTNSNIKGIKITTITGKVVKEIIPTTNTINVSELLKGVYIIEIQTDIKVIRRFIKE